MVAVGGPPVSCARSWSWAVFPRALRSRWSWGIGDLRDLAAVAAWAKETGARYLVTGPLCAAGGCPPVDPSPYSPSSRLFLDVALLHVPWVEGWEMLPPATRRRALDRARELERSSLVELDEVLALKLDVLRQMFGRIVSRPPPAELLDHRRERGRPLELFAVHRTAEACFGPWWPEWPEALRTPEGALVSTFVGENRSEIAFHAWCQWQLDRQLARAASSGVGLVRDLPVGAPWPSAEGWMWQSVLDPEHELGAPGDYFNPAGHRWGLAPFDRHALREACYGPVRELVASGARHAAGIRIDHALGLLRQYWIPRGRPMGAGRYVAQPTGELVDVLVEEADRAGVFLITEELGTPPPAGAGPLRDRGLLRLVAVASEEYEHPGPHDAVTATTHDLPTVAGAWTGADERALRAAGIEPDHRVAEAQRRRLARCAHVPAAAAVDEVVPALYGALAATDSPLVIVPIEDALGLVDRPNVPGTSPATWPNFRRRLPDVEEITGHPLVHRVAAAIGEAR